MLDLPKKSFEVIFGWLEQLESEYLSHIVHCMKGYVKFAIASNINVVNAVMLLEHLANMNQVSRILPYDSFYIPDLKQYVDLTKDYADFW